MYDDHHVHVVNWEAPLGPQPGIRAAERRGLRRLGCVANVSRTTPWIHRFVTGIRTAAMRSSVSLTVGLEVEVLDTAGALDLPPVVRGVERLFIADHYLPIGTRRLLPRQARALIEAGVLQPVELVDAVVGALALAIRNAPLPVVLAHPLSGLVAAGVDVHAVGLAHLEPLIASLQQVRGAVEVNEEHQAPDAIVASMFATAGLALLPASDALLPEEVGQFRHVSDCLRHLYRPAA